MSDHVADHLRDKQFKKMGQAGRLNSIFMSEEEILRAPDNFDLEPWSKHMVNNIRIAPPTAD